MGRLARLRAVTGPSCRHGPRTFVALGDSFTEGLHDELGADGRHRGWADRVAGALAARTTGTDLGYANLAVRGRLLGQVVADQVPRAERLAADLVTFHAGANDVLRPGTDMAGLARAYRDAVGRLAATSGQLVLFTVVGRAGRRGRIAERVAARFDAFNANVRESAAAVGATVVDLAAVAALTDPRLWHEDRLHLVPAGHVRVAAATLEALGVRDRGLLGGDAGWWRQPPPARTGGDRRGLAEDARWARQHLLPWVLRRVRGISSGDGVVPKRPEPRPVADDRRHGVAPGT